jgi:hypothetical protein
MSLVSQIISGSAAAISIAQNYLLSPFVAGVRIETVGYKEIMDNDISEQVIIDADKGKMYQTDNVAPKPKMWTIQGYLTPTIAEVFAFSPLLMPSLFLQKQVLRDARSSRQPIPFIPLNKEELNNPITGALMVSIKHIDFDTLPDVQNKVPVNITLKEVPILSLLNDISITNATPASISNAASSQVDVGIVPSISGALSIPGAL